MLFSTIGRAALAIASLEADAVVGAARRKKIEKVIAKVAADKSATTGRANCGQRGMPTGRTGTDIFFHHLPRFSFSGS